MVPMDAMDEREGLLVPPGDERSLAAAIARLLDDSGLARRLGEQGRRKVEREFDSRKNAARLAELIAPAVAAGLHSNGSLTGDRSVYGAAALNSKTVSDRFS